MSYVQELLIKIINEATTQKKKIEQETKNNDLNTAIKIEQTKINLCRTILYEIANHKIVKRETSRQSD